MHAVCTVYFRFNSCLRKAWIYRSHFPVQMNRNYYWVYRSTRLCMWSGILFVCISICLFLTDNQPEIHSTHNLQMEWQYLFCPFQSKMLRQLICCMWTTCSMTASKNTAFCHLLICIPYIITTTTMALEKQLDNIPWVLLMWYCNEYTLPACNLKGCTTSAYMVIYSAKLVWLVRQ